MPTGDGSGRRGSGDVESAAGAAVFSSLVRIP